MTVNKAIRALLDLLAVVNRLDRPALDRINAAICGAIDRELAAHEERERRWRRRMGGQPDSPAPNGAPLSPADDQLVMDVERAA